MDKPPFYSEFGAIVSGQLSLYFGFTAKIAGEESARYHELSKNFVTLVVDYKDGYQYSSVLSSSYAEAARNFTVLSIITAAAFAGFVGYRLWQYHKQKRKS